jgi:hypothetical protein
MKNFCFALIVLLCFSCKKEENNLYSFKYLDIEDAYGLVIGKYSSANDAYRLFKLNATDMLQTVKYLDGNKSVVEPRLTPVVGYDLNDDYLLITFRKENQSVLESFLIRRFDGFAQHLSKAVIAESGGTTDFRTEAIRHDNKSRYYFTNSEGNWLLDLTDINNPVVKEAFAGEELDKNFSVDYMGNLLTNKKIILSAGDALDLKWRNSSYTFPVKSYINNMYYIFRNADSIQCSRIDVSSNPVTDEKLYPSFLLTDNEAAFVNSHIFPSFNKTVVTLSSAILLVEGTAIRKIDLKALDIQHIFSSLNSTNYCYIAGADWVGSKIFVRVDFKSAQPRYSQLFAPGDVNVSSFSVSPEGNLVFSGNKISSGKKIFGFVPLSGDNWIFDDDEGIDELQVLIR